MEETLYKCVECKKTQTSSELELSEKDETFNVYLMLCECGCGRFWPPLSEESVTEQIMIMIPADKIDEN